MKNAPRSCALAWTKPPVTRWNFVRASVKRMKPRKVATIQKQALGSRRVSTVALPSAAGHSPGE